MCTEIWIIEILSLSLYCNQNNYNRKRNYKQHERHCKLHTQE